MESMEDSGIESDPKPVHDKLVESEGESHVNSKSDVLTIVSRKTDLQRKLEKQREQSARSQHQPTFVQPKKSSFLMRNKLAVPEKSTSNSEESKHLLVHIPTDESEDEFELPITLSSNREITEQLIKDGYNLDLEPDDEDLDLIPPRPISEQCVCCQVHQSCSIQ